MDINLQVLISTKIIECAHQLDSQIIDNHTIQRKCNARSNIPQFPAINTMERALHERQSSTRCPYIWADPKCYTHYMVQTRVCVALQYAREVLVRTPLAWATSSQFPVPGT